MSYWTKNVRTSKPTGLCSSGLLVTLGRVLLVFRQTIGWLQLPAGQLPHPSDVVLLEGRGPVRADQHPSFAPFFRPLPSTNSLSPGSASPFVGLAALFGMTVFACWAARKIVADPEPSFIRGLATEVGKEQPELLAADVKGWPRPPKCNGRIPDVYAVLPGGIEVAIEVENEKSAHSSHARKQARDLRAWEAESPRRIFLQEIVKGGRGGRG